MSARRLASVISPRCHQEDIVVSSDRVTRRRHQRSEIEMALHRFPNLSIRKPARTTTTAFLRRRERGSNRVDVGHAQRGRRRIKNTSWGGISKRAQQRWPVALFVTPCQRWFVKLFPAQTSSSKRVGEVARDAFVEMLGKNQEAHRPEVACWRGLTSPSATLAVCPFGEACREPAGILTSTRRWRKGDCTPEASSPSPRRSPPSHRDTSGSE